MPPCHVIKSAFLNQSPIKSNGSKPAIKKESNKIKDTIIVEIKISEGKYNLQRTTRIAFKITDDPKIVAMNVKRIYSLNSIKTNDLIVQLSQLKEYLYNNNQK